MTKAPRQGPVTRRLVEDVLRLCMATALRRVAGECPEKAPREGCPTHNALELSLVAQIWTNCGVMGAIFCEEPDQGIPERSKSSSSRRIVSPNFV